MEFKASQNADITFITHKNGVNTTADSLPEATLVLGGVDIVATVEVAPHATVAGVYTANWTMPADLSSYYDNSVQLRIAATIDGTDTVGVLPVGQVTRKRTYDLNDPTVGQITADIDANSTQLAGIIEDTAEIGAAGAGLTAITGVELAADQAVNVTKISGDSTAADNLELQYDGTGIIGSTFPATQEAVGNLTSGTAAINTTAIDSPGGFSISAGLTEVNTEDVTHALDGTVHSILPSAGGTTDVYYIFDVGGNGVPVSVTWNGYANSNGDSYSVYAKNWTTTNWEQIGSIDGASGTTIVTKTFDLTNAHVGTGTDKGIVHFQLYSTDGTKIATDRVICSYAVVSQSVGYSQGAIWVEAAGTAGSEVYVNGTADSPCPWANALTLNESLGLNSFRIANGDTVTLSASAAGYSMIGTGWTLALESQAIDGMFVEGASVSGIGTATVTQPRFQQCGFGNVTLPPCTLHRCCVAGTITAGSAGQFYIVDGVSMVAGSGSPTFNFSGTGGTTGINNRRWAGGATYILDADCTLSHEVLAGGGTTVTSAGADVEIRGITRSVTLHVAGSTESAIQFVGTTGPIVIDGEVTASTTAINLYGVSSYVTDSTTGAGTVTITDSTISNTNVVDEWETQSQADPTGFNVNVLEVSGITQEYIATTAGVVDTVTDLTNSVSLDAAQEVTVTSIANDTITAASIADNALEAKGDWNTVTPLNAAETQSECNDALVALRLDHLLAVADADDAVNDSVIAKLASSTGDWSTFVDSTDSLQAIRDRGDSAWVTGGGASTDRLLLQETTIATLASQTSFTLSDGSADDDAYNNAIIIIEDASTSIQKAFGTVSDYTGSTKTITLVDPGIFTMAATDKIYIFAAGSASSGASAADIADAVWDEVLIGSTHNVPTSAGRRLRDIASDTIISGTAQAPYNDYSITLDSNASAISGTYDPARVLISGGTGIGQSRQIFQYDSNKTAYVNRNWKVTPAADTEYTIFSDSGDTHVNEGAAQGGGDNTITLNTLASSHDNVYVGQLVYILAGTGADQASYITAYDGDTKIATVEGNSIDGKWATNPDTTSVYAILPMSVHNKTGYSLSTTGVLEIWDQLTSELTAAGSIGKKVTDWVVGKVTSIDTDTITAASIADNALVAKGDWNTTTPLNAAEVRSECDDALTNIHLDHLLAVDYDPESKPGVPTALFNELIESDAGISRYTVNALENGPSGSGSSAEVIAQTVWAKLTSEITTADSIGKYFLDLENINQPVADGVVWEYTVTDEDSNPIPDTTVMAKYDGTFVQSRVTDVSGVASFFLSPETYDFYSYKVGYNFTNPDTEIVS